MEFDKSLIEKSLEIYGFDKENIEIDKICHVPMHEWRVSKKDKPLLYIENLQCCVCLYIYGNNYAFASHINTIVFDNNEYKLNSKKEPICCSRCVDLINEVLKYKGEISEPFKIGISYGVTPLSKYEKSISLIYEGINRCIEILNSLNIPVIKLDDMYNPEFIIDSQNNNLIFPKTLSKKIQK